MIQLQAIDYLILAVCFIFVLGTGWRLRGLVYSLTSREKHPELAWHEQPLTFGVIVPAAGVLLNIPFG